MAEELPGAAVQMVSQGSIETLKMLLKLIEVALQERNRDSTKHGQQSLQALNKQGRQLESVNIPSEDIKEFRRQLNRFNVDFSIMRDRGTGENAVFFRAQDVDRVYQGLEGCLKWMFLDKVGTQKSIKDVMENAVRKAEEQAQNAQKTEERQKKKEVEYPT